MRTKLKIKYAEHKNNGIYFYSNRHKEYGVNATIDENGNIKVEWTANKEEKSDKEKKDDLKRDLLLIFDFVILALLCEYTKSMEFTKAVLVLRIILIGWPLMLLIRLIMANSKKSKEYNMRKKFHSAKHMVINGYTKLGRVPLLEEISQFSQFSNSCSTNILIHIIIGCFFGVIGSFFPDAFIGIMLFGVLIDFILLKLGYLNFLQKFTTSTPTNEELTVAIEGMRLWLENEKKR